MNEVIFTKKAIDALVEQALYIFNQAQDMDIADRYLDEMESFNTSILSSFPKAGRPAEEFGSDVRKLVYQGYSILYKIKNQKIFILTLFRENLTSV